MRYHRVITPFLSPNSGQCFVLPCAIARAQVACRFLINRLVKSARPTPRRFEIVVGRGPRRNEGFDNCVLDTMTDSGNGGCWAPSALFSSHRLRFFWAEFQRGTPRPSFFQNPRELGGSVYGSKPTGAFAIRSSASSAER
jgi:hypothetical protein